MSIASLVIWIVIISILAAVIMVQADSAYATPVPTFPLDHNWNLIIGNQSYPIRYSAYGGSGISGVVESISVDLTSKSITTIINDSNTESKEGYFTIELPRDIINSNTTEIAGGCTSSFTSDNPPIWIQEHDLPYQISVTALSEGNREPFIGNQSELCDRDTRTLSIEYPTGSKSMIMIQGTVMVPEFSPLVILAITVGAIGIVIMTGRIMRFRDWKN